MSFGQIDTGLFVVPFCFLCEHSNTVYKDLDGPNLSWKIYDVEILNNAITFTLYVCIYLNAIG